MLNLDFLLEEVIQRQKPIDWAGECSKCPSVSVPLTLTRTLILTLTLFQPLP